MYRSCKMTSHWSSLIMLFMALLVTGCNNSEDPRGKISPTFTVNLDQTEVIVSSTTALADGLEVIIVDVIVKDVNGKRLQGLSIEVTCTGTMNTVNGFADLTNSRGEVFGAEVSSTLAESKQIIVRVIDPLTGFSVLLDPITVTFTI